MHILASAHQTVRVASERRSAERQIMYHWVRLHWFELSALVLLGLNLWFVIKVLSVLRAVRIASSFLLAGWISPEAKLIASGTPETTPASARGRSTIAKSC